MVLCFGHRQCVRYNTLMQNEDQVGTPNDANKPTPSPTPTPTIEAQNSEPTATPVMPDPADETPADARNLFSDDADSDVTVPDEDDEQPFDPNSIVGWTGPEFIHHQKQSGWYLVYSVVAVILIAIIYLVTKDIPSTVVIAAGALMFGIYSARKPRDVQYVLTPTGIKISQKAYGLENFRSFAVVEEVGVDTIVFLPLKRFSPSLTICYPADQEERIITLLSPLLPQSDYQHDAVDRLMHRIRF